MPVFKAYVIVIKKKLPSLLIYFAVFVMMTIIFSKFVGNQTSLDFSAIKNNIVIQSEENTPLVDGLKDYLGQNTNIVSVGDEKDALEDALFFGKVDYVLRVPAGFTESFLSGGDTITLEKITGAMSANSVNVDLLINKYFEVARLYVLNINGVSQETIVTNVMTDLSKTAAVQLDAGHEQVKIGSLDDTFRYMAYAVLAIMLEGVISIMMAFNDPEVSRRNLCAPISPAKMSLQILSGNVLFMLVVWAALCVIANGLNGSLSVSPGFLLLYLNVLVFAVACLSIAFLAGKFIKSDIAQAAMANVVSLGICFLSGIFVPQYLLGETVLRIASFTPGYWYVKTIDTIKELSVFSFDSLKPIFGYMLIQLAFAAACIIIALVASKQKRQNMGR